MAADRTGASAVEPWPGPTPMHLDAPLPWPAVADRIRQDLVRAKTWRPGSLLVADRNGELVELAYAPEANVALGRGLNGLPRWVADLLIGSLVAAGQVQIGGNLNHDGDKVGLFGVAPAVRPSAYTISNDAPLRTLDVATATLPDVANVVATVIRDLASYGALQVV